MDKTNIIGFNYSHGYSKMELAQSKNLYNELVSKKNADKTDALSAVKLDPAVLEAQVTIESASNTTNCGSKMVVPEQMTRRDSQLPYLNFEETLASLHRNTLLNLTSQQYSLLMIYVNNLRKQRVSFQKHNECAFCKNNGHSVMWYTSHALKDRKGRVRCPMLRALQCPRCGDTGDRAHTIKYCPK